MELSSSPVIPQYTLLSIGVARKHYPSCWALRCGQPQFLTGDTPISPPYIPHLWSSPKCFIVFINSMWDSDRIKRVSCSVTPLWAAPLFYPHISLLARWKWNLCKPLHLGRTLNVHARISNIWHCTKWAIGLQGMFTSHSMTNKCVVVDYLCNPTTIWKNAPLHSIITKV